MLKQLRCGHFKQVKPRRGNGWYPWCLECLRKASLVPYLDKIKQLESERDRLKAALQENITDRDAWKARAEALATACREAQRLRELARLAQEKK